MNTTQNNETHIKVQMGNEIRRFVLSSTVYSELIAILRQMFGITDALLKVCFLDEEEDWITITSTEEFSYATELSPHLLRLKVSVLDEQSETESESPATECETPSTDKMWKGNKRGGGRGRGAGRGCKNWTYEDRLNAKSTRLTDRIQTIQQKLNSDQISKEQSRVLSWRLQKLQSKLAEVQSTQQPSEASIPSLSPDSAPFHPRGRGRGGRGRGRGGRAVSNDVNQSDVWLLKQDLLNARKSGDKEAIASAQEALKNAKKDARNKISPEKADLLNSKKEEVIQRRQTMIEARKSGDKAQVQACKEALQQAKMEFKQAKWESFV